MERLARYLTPEDAATLRSSQAHELGVDEVAVVKNLEYVYPPHEFYPLAPKVTLPLDRITAFAVDMDGTSTTTEPLALHALEHMVRRFTGRMTKVRWPGLDEQKDYPHVIGSSNFRHTEFLVQRYERRLDHSALRSSFFEALLWTLANMEDEQRIRDVRFNAVNCGLGAMLEDPEFRRITREGPVGEESVAEAVRPFLDEYGPRFRCDTPGALVSAALDIYYARYHSILRRVERGESARLAKELLGTSGRRLIEPMPGYAVFICMLKGWLGEEAGRLSAEMGGRADAETEARLARLGKRFEECPAKIALVTASIDYEAHAVVNEVFRVMREQVESWSVGKAKKKEIAERLDDYRAVYDGFVTASDSSEARLKPHPDLYGIALHQMSIAKEDYCRCVGLEDTEPGIIALRAAGIGCAVALPNRDTSRQDYRAASLVITGGLPELLMGHSLLVEHAADG